MLLGVRLYIPAPGCLERHPGAGINLRLTCRNRGPADARGRLQALHFRESGEHESRRVV